MTHLIIDLKSIISHPHLVCYSHPAYKFYIDDCYLDKELLAFDPRIPKHSIVDFLQRAKELGTVISLRSTEQPIKALFPFATSLNYVNLINILTDAHKILKKGNDGSRILIVTHDERFKDLKITPGEAIKEIKQAGGVFNAELTFASTNLSDELFVSFAKYSLILLALIAMALFDYIHKTINSDMPRSLVLLAMVLVIAWGLFTLRAKRRFWYGALEVMIGLMVTGAEIFFSNVHEFDEFNYLKIATGIYIIIRGLDNIEKGLLETNNMHLLKLFRKVF